MTSIPGLKIKLYADGANRDDMLRMHKNPSISGFTTNPTLMRKAGITDYRAFAFDILSAIPDRPISFEVFADDLDEMESQAREIATWGRNVAVKIPVTNTEGQFTGRIIRKLSAAGIYLNVTALFTVDQVRKVVDCLSPEVPAIISVFAGRIADTGLDPVPLMSEALKIVRERPNAELLWASPRELLNVFQANDMGCDIITATSDILNKLSLYGKDLGEFSLETVQMFYSDALAAGFDIPVAAELEPA